jgi:hypothetical protein
MRFSNIETFRFLQKLDDSALIERTIFSGSVARGEDHGFCSDGRGGVSPVRRFGEDVGESAWTMCELDERREGGCHSRDLDAPFVS